MKDKVLILANLIQKIALWKIEFNRSDRIKEHIRMLDWVISRIRVVSFLIHSYEIKRP